MGRGKAIKKPATGHEEMINEFIPEAERYADRVFPDWNQYTTGRGDWSFAFLWKMNELTIAAGLRVPFGEERVA